MNHSFHCTGQMTDIMNIGTVWMSVLLMSVSVDRVAHGGSGVMVLAGLCYGQHFNDGILNAKRE